MYSEWKEHRTTESPTDLTVTGYFFDWRDSNEVESCAQTIIFKMCSLVFCVPISFGLDVVLADINVRLQRYRHR